MPSLSLPNDVSTNTFNDGYSKFKTPFFEVSIGLPDGSPPVTLPQQVARLIQKVEVVENYITDVCSVDYFTVVLTEGSREPFEQTSSTSTSEVYPVDDYAGDTITNSSGSLLDLRFVAKSGVAGITGLTSAGKVASSLPSSFNINDPNVITVVAVRNKPNYLFQEGNIVTIKWGYKEQDKIRVIANPILMIQTDFPETGQPTVTLICQSPVALLDQVSTPIGQNYKISTSFSLNESGIRVLDYSDISTSLLLNNFCTKHGIVNVTDTNLINDILDKNGTKVWHAGQSFIEFIKALAYKSNCSFTVRLDPNNNYKYTLEFIKNVNLLSKTTIPSDLDNLLTWKGKGSILKSFSVKADFAALVTTAHVGIDNSGKLQAAATADGGSQVVQFSNKSLFINSDPGSKSAVADSIISNETNSSGTGFDINVNKVNVNPNAEAPTVLSNSALADYARCGNKQISIELKTLGYPYLMAGQVVNIGNVGKRYSTRYKLYTVTHTLDSSGYNTMATGFGFNIDGTVGIQPNGAPGFQPPSTTINSQLFSALNSNGTIPSLPSLDSDLSTESRNNRFASV